MLEVEHLLGWDDFDCNEYITKWGQGSADFELPLSDTSKAFLN